MLPIFAVLLFYVVAEGREIQVNLNAPWASRSVDPIIEVAEFISQHSSASLWSYVDQLCLNSKVVDDSLNSSSVDIFDGMMEVALSSGTSAVPSPLHGTMKASVMLGMHAPAVEFFTAISSSYGEPCGYGQAYAVSSKKSYCDLETKSFAAAFSREDNSIISTWDYRYPSSASIEDIASTWSLHGVPGSSSFCRLHSALRKGSEAGEIAYLMRPTFPIAKGAAQSAARTIQGYGVFLDIKNMEYHNADDTPPPVDDEGELQQQNAQEDVSFEEGEEVSGLMMATLQTRRPAITKELALLKKELLVASEVEGGKGGDMKVWKMLDLGLQTTGTIVSSADPVRTMNDLLHNFPKHASSLSSSRVAPQLREDVSKWYGSVASTLPSNSVYINGVRVDLGGSTFNMFSLMGQILEEAQSMDYLSSDAANISGLVRQKLLGIAADLSSPPSSGGLPPVTRIDVSRGGKYAISFMNNLEKDPQYGRMPKTVKQLLQPSYSLHAVRRNLYTLVAFLDPVSTAGASMLTQLNGMFMQQYPIRFGVALACQNTDYERVGEWDGKDASWMASSEDVCRLFHHTRKTYGTQTGFAFMNAVASVIEEEAENMFEPSFEATQSSSIATATPEALGTNFLTRVSLVALYSHTVMKKEGSSAGRATYMMDATAVMTSTETNDFVVNSTQYGLHRGLKVNSYALNGMVQETHDIVSAMMQLLGREQFMLSQMVRKGLITDKTKSIYASIIDLEEDVYERYHPLLDEEKPIYIDTSSIAFNKIQSHVSFYHNGVASSEEPSSSHQQCASVDTTVDVQTMYNTTFIYFPVTTPGLRSALAVADWVISEGLSASNGEETCASGGSEHFDHLVAFVTQSSSHLENGSSSGKLAVLSRLTSFGSVHSSADIFVLKYALERFIEGSSVDDCIDNLMKQFPANNGVLSLLSLMQDKDAMKAQVELAAAVSRLAVVALRNGDDDVHGSVIVHNGRALVVLDSDSPLHALDLKLLSKVEHKRMGIKMKSLLMSNTHSSGSRFTGVDYLNLCSFCGRYASSGSARYNVLDVLDSMGNGKLPSHAINIPPLLDVTTSETSSGIDDISLVYVIDPLSIAGQRAAAVVQFVQQELKLHQTVVLVPDMEVTEFPLQNFFRFVVGSSSSSATTSGQAAAVFKNLPRQHTLTVRVDAPEAWNVQAYRAVQDIDNLVCENRRCGDVAGDSQEKTIISYRIKSLLVAGQCFQDFHANPSPPNGLQLVMSRMTGDEGVIEHFSDTLVMQNLGYWQLQANPGLWSLSLAEGRASTLYDIGESSGVIVGGNVIIPVRSFADAISYLYVEKKEGMRHLSLLDSGDEDRGGDGEASNSMWNSLSGMFGGNQQKKKVKGGGDDADETIHVFSLATGQVYERLLRIMMLSVKKRTSSPVKFWLFEYYLSPAFKQTVDAMCKQYGFEVGYVTYKWPEWLTQQTVKQRIIWGYKILFLDVLFPLDVKKVIYVDADQVVRSDLKELWDMDLEGKPYAYTPFCDSREETL